MPLQGRYPGTHRIMGYQSRNKDCHQKQRSKYQQWLGKRNASALQVPVNQNYPDHQRHTSQYNQGFQVCIDHPQWDKPRSKLIGGNIEMEERRQYKQYRKNEQDSSGYRFTTEAIFIFFLVTQGQLKPVSGNYFGKNLFFRGFLQPMIDHLVHFRNDFWKLLHQIIFFMRVIAQIIEMKKFLIPLVQGIVLRNIGYMEASY